MSWSFLQSKSGTTGSSSIGVPWTSSSTAGSLLIAAAYSNGSSMSVGDSGNGTWTPVGSQQTGIGALAAFSLQLFYVLSAVGGAAVPTLNLVGSNSSGLAIHEYASSLGSVAVDGTPVYNTPTGADPVTSGTITTTVNGSLLFCAGICESSMLAQTPANPREQINFGSNVTEDILDGGTAGAKTIQCNPANSTDDNILGFIAFLEAAPAPIMWLGTL